LHCAVLGAGWEAFEHMAERSAHLAKAIRGGTTEAVEL